MTPDQGNQPLPSSNSVKFLEQPKTQYEWRYVLKVIKVEHQKGQWKQCLRHCDQLLHTTSSPPLPLHVACLHFYTALSEEALARQMHVMSMAKIRALQYSKSCFEQAVLTLPVPDSCTNGSDTSFAGSDVDDSASLEDSISSVEAPSQFHKSASPLSETFKSLSPSIHLQSPPLHICKSVSQSFSDKRNFFEARLDASTTPSPKTPSFNSPAPTSPVLEKPLPATPLPISNIRNASNTQRRTIASSDSIRTPSQTRVQEYYNEQLRDFAKMLAKHIYFVEEAIMKTQEAQATGRRRLIKERQSSEDEEDVKRADLGERIARLKAKGWMRERFVPARYQELCEKALDEL